MFDKGLIERPGCVGRKNLYVLPLYRRYQDPGRCWLKVTSLNSLYIGV